MPILAQVISDLYGRGEGESTVIISRIIVGLMFNSR